MFATHAQESLTVSDTLQNLYDLVVETETVVLNDCLIESENVGEVLVHRFYVEAQDSTDKLDAVFGNNQDTLIINAPGGVYNNSFNFSWNASGLNPGLILFSPCLQDDSYATINLDGPASSVPGAEDLSMVQDSQLSPTVSEFLQQNTLGEPAELTVNTLTGAGNNSSNFSAKPGGRRMENGNFYHAGTDGYWWSSTLTSSGASYKRIRFDEDQLFEEHAYPRFGFSVRCIQDSE